MHNLQPKLLHSVKLSFKFDRAEGHFKSKLKPSIITKATSQKTFSKSRKESQPREAAKNEFLGSER